MLVKLAQYFQVSTDYLLGIDDDRGGIDTSKLDEQAIVALSSIAEMLKKD